MTQTVFKLLHITSYVLLQLVRWTDVGFRGAALNMLGAGAGAAAAAATAEAIIACTDGLLGTEDPNMAGAGGGRELTLSMSMRFVAGFAFWDTGCRLEVIEIVVGRVEERRRFDEKRLVHDVPSFVEVGLTAGRALLVAKGP